ncbi:hypothetical protein G3I60_08155 [Streptomyces sp. SID13666]|nr:hypothetical protein [Streptomyces sp. SID13666]NEA70223.1 hypothetical protein [Streptomyces sp. SID13588]
MAHDRTWEGEAFTALSSSAAVLALLLVMDWGSGGLDTTRAVLWTALAALLYVILHPPRVTAGHGWLAVGGPLREQRVSTDCLVSVRRIDGVATRLVLRDVYGNRVEFNPKVLATNPALWLLVNAGACRSWESGTLLCGWTEVEAMAARYGVGPSLSA